MFFAVSLNGLLFRIDLSDAQGPELKKPQTTGADRPAARRDRRRIGRHMRRRAEGTLSFEAQRSLAMQYYKLLGWSSALEFGVYLVELKKEADRRDDQQIKEYLSLLFQRLEKENPDAINTVFFMSEENIVTLIQAGVLSMNDLSALCEHQKTLRFAPMQFRDVGPVLTKIRTYADFKKAFSNDSFRIELEVVLNEVGNDPRLGKNFQKPPVRAFFNDSFFPWLENKTGLSSEKTADEIKAAIESYLKSIKPKECAKATHAAIVLFLRRILHRIPDSTAPFPKKARDPEGEPKEGS